MSKRKLDWSKEVYQIAYLTNTTPEEVQKEIDKSLVGEEFFVTFFFSKARFPTENEQIAMNYCGKAILNLLE